MLKILLAATLLTLNLVLMFSQSTVHGIVKDSQNRAVEGVAVVMQSADSTFIDAVITDSLGYFNLKKGDGGSFLIFQHLLFVTRQIEFNGSDVGTITLKEKEYVLGEIVVKGERPQVKIRNGALQYDVSRITDNKAVSNAYETLLYLPGVNEQNGSLSLVGTNELSILLNGKPSTMSQEQLSNLLKNTPASKLDKAEVVYNAPAHYHVRGAVINLVMKKNAIEDILQGETNATYNQKYYANSSAVVSLAYAKNKFSSDLLYSHEYGKLKSGLDLYSRHLYENEIHNIEQKNRGYSKMSGHNIHMSLNYDFSSGNKLAFAYTGDYAPNKRSSQHSFGNISECIILGKSEESMTNFNLEFSSHFGLAAGIDYTHYNSPAEQDFNAAGIENEALSFVANSNQTINRWKTYISQNHTLDNGFSINYGGSFTRVNNVSYQTYTTESGRDMSDSDSGSNVEEYTCNLYGGLDKKWASLSLSLSLAGEYYEIDEQGEWSLYPTGQLTYMESPAHILQLSFASNKSYPNYWLWQDNVGYLNGYTEIHGNPHLKPSKKYATRFNYIMKSKYVFSLYYNTVEDYFLQQPYQSPNRLVMVYQTQNIDKKRELGSTIVVPFSAVRFMNSNLTIDGSYNREKSNNFYDSNLDKTKWRIFARIDNTIKVSSFPEINLEFSGMYMSPLIQGVYDMTDIWQVDAGIKLTFASKNAELRLKCVDLFNRFIPDLEVHYDSQNITVYPVRDNRTVVLSFVYKFGNYRNKSGKQVDSSRFGH